ARDRGPCLRRACVARFSQPANFSESCMNKKMTTRLLSVTALLLAAGASGIAPASSAPATPQCSMSVTLADWGENSSGDIDVASGESCQIPIGIRGTVTDSSIAQKPSYGKLKKINASTFEYKAKAKYKGNDTFAIKATGQGPKASGTSVITVHVTTK